jgi:multiple sugar transport system ATP-binding protein
MLDVGGPVGEPDDLAVSWPMPTAMNLLEATVDDGALRAGPVGLPMPTSASAHLTAGERVVVGVRPEYAALHPREVPQAIAGAVTLLESLGSAFLVSVEGDGTRVQVTVPEGRQPAVGDRAWVVPDPERLLVYRKDDGHAHDAVVLPGHLLVSSP